MAEPPATEAAPKTKIPSILADFVKANNDRDTDTVTACFSKDAVVYDAGHIMRGTGEIRQWSAELFQKFRYVIAPTNAKGEATLVTGRASSVASWLIVVASAALRWTICALSCRHPTCAPMPIETQARTR
jgi:hypothetical protein